MGDGHSLGGLGEIVSFAEHDHLAPFTINFLQACEEIGAARKWLRSHTLCHSLLWLRFKMRWLHLRDHCPSPLLHMVASMILIMIPYVSIVLIFIGIMIRGETHWLDVSFGEEDSHTFCSTCSKGSMGGDWPPQ